MASARAPLLLCALLSLGTAPAAGQSEAEGSVQTSGQQQQQQQTQTQGQTTPDDPKKLGQERAEALKQYLRSGKGHGGWVVKDPEFLEALGKMDPDKYKSDVLGFLQNPPTDGKGNHINKRTLWHLVDPDRDSISGSGAVTGMPGDPAGSDRHGSLARYTQAQANLNEYDSATLARVPPQHQSFEKSQNILATKEQLNGNHSGALRGYEGIMSRGNAGADTYAYASLSALNTGEPRKAVTYSLKSLEMDPNGPMSEQATAINRLAVKRLPKEEDPKAPIRGSDSHDPSPTPRTSASAKASAAADTIPELDRPLQPRAAAAGLPPEALAVVAETNRLMALASKAYRAGDMKEAVKLSAETLAKDPDDVRALQVSAAAHAKEGKWEEVRREADRGLDLAPGYVPLLLLRSASAIHVKDWRSAKADAAAVLAKEKANPTAWRFMGIAQSGLGEREESVTSLSHAVQYGDPEARRLLALARSLPPGADAADLVEMLANAADGLETASAAHSAAPPRPARRLKTAVVFAAAVMTGIVVGGLIFLAGRSETESS